MDSGKISAVTATALTIAFWSAATPAAQADPLDYCQISVGRPPPVGQGPDCYFLWWHNQNRPQAPIGPNDRKLAAAVIEAGKIPCRQILNDYNGDFFAYYRANPTVDIRFVSVAISTYCPSLAP
jgi:hypothetical protein